MKPLRKIAALIILVFLISNISCSGVPIKIDSIAKQPIDTTKGRAITAQACGFQLLLLIPIRINSRLERAYQSLRHKAEGGYIADVKVREKWRYGFVGTGYCTILEATAYPYITKELQENK